MAKKQETNREQRQSRKEYLRAQRESAERRRIFMALGGVGALVLIIILFAIINEYIIAPQRPVATINGEEISLTDWENRVRYERAQRIIVLENLYEQFNKDVGLIQQFAGQQIQELFLEEDLGQAVIDIMVNEAIIRQLAEERGITVSEADIDEAIEESFLYFDGNSPTPQPTATETVMPTPSLTPIPTPVITEVVELPTAEPTATAGPPATLQPTATAVSLDSFQEQFDGILIDFGDLGIDEATYRDVIRAQVYQRLVTDALAEEFGISREAEHSSFYIISFDTEAEANEAAAMVENDGFLTVWNTFKSIPFSEDSTSTAQAFEILSRTQTELTNFGAEVQGAAFSLEIGATSDILLSVNVQTGEEAFFLIQVNGREVREISDNAYDSLTRGNLTSFLDGEITSGEFITTEFWINRVPTQPILDQKFLVQPTPDPAQAVPPTTNEDNP